MIRNTYSRITSEYASGYHSEKSNSSFLYIGWLDRDVEGLLERKYIIVDIYD